MSYTEEEYLELLKGPLIKKPKNVVPDAPKKKKSKYGNKKVKVDGLSFDSQHEANYYGELKLRLKAGDIKGYCRQAEFILLSDLEDLKPMTYVCDFIVFNNDDTTEIIDTKGILTDVYKNKRKIFRDKYPKLRIKEVYK